MMNRFRLPMFITFAASGLFAQAIVYDSIPALPPPNVTSQGFQCCATSEFGDQITLSGTHRVGGFVTVLMSSWAKQSDWPTMPAGGYTHPITLNIYADAASAGAHAPLASVTQTFFVPWRSEPDATCPHGGTGWRSPVDHNCYTGNTFTIKFDLRTAGLGGAPLQLPDTLIFGVAYNTQSWGYHPLGTAGPYDFLNVALNDSAGPTVGTDVDPDAVFWKSDFGPLYPDSGAGGVGVFRHSDGWTPYVPAVQFTTFAFPVTKDDCKEGSWQNLVRPNFTPFKNQGACVTHVATGK